MCGIFGITDTKDASKLAYVGLFTLQHRGQESAGIVSAYRSELRHHIGMGLVSEVFYDGITSLPGRTAIGHVRYATTGTGDVLDAQPIVVDYPFGLAMVHNGNVVNFAHLRRHLYVLLRGPGLGAHYDLVHHLVHLKIILFHAQLALLDGSPVHQIIYEP